MRLQVGEQIEGAGRSAYRIGECRQDTPWYRLYSARKVFFNYRFEQREFYEASEDEWIDVLVRGLPNRESGAQSPGAHSQLSTLNPQLLADRLRYEASSVLAGQPGWFPEPVDWLQTEHGELSSALGPLLVMSCPRGEPLDQWRANQLLGSPRALRIAAEMLDMLSTLHERGQIIGGFGPDDFLIDEVGRLFFMATDRVVPTADSQQLRPLYPPERYPSGFSAPETNDPDSPLDAASDLYSWAAVALFLLSGGERSAESRAASAAGSPRQEPGSLRSSAHRSPLAALLSGVSKALEQVAARDPDALWAWLPRRDRRSPKKLIFLWTTCLERCLAVDRPERPQSVTAIRRLAARRLPLLSWSRLRRR